MNNSLKRRVMTRIYFEYARDTLVERVDYIMLILFIGSTLALTSIRNVVENMPKDNLAALVNFFVIALKNTSFVLQAMIAGFIARASAASFVTAYISLKNFDVVRWLSRFKLNSNTEKGSL